MDLVEREVKIKRGSITKRYYGGGGGGGVEYAFWRAVEKKQRPSLRAKNVTGLIAKPLFSIVTIREYKRIAGCCQIQV